MLSRCPSRWSKSTSTARIARLADTRPLLSRPSKSCACHQAKERGEEFSACLVKITSGTTSWHTRTQEGQDTLMVHTSTHKLSLLRVCLTPAAVP
eukprot:366278-Chlamydomonas_euryale.AAC.37